MSSSKKPVKSQPDLSIVIPAYCEERRIGKTLGELAAFLKHDPFFSRKTVEVVVVAADAPDSTHEIVAAKQSLFNSHRLSLVFLKPGPHVGKGRDVQYGMLRATGKIVVFMDADLATPLHHLKECYEACEHGSDVVIGTRDLFHYRSGAWRNLFSGFGNRLYQLVGGVYVEDTQCGFKMFSHKAAQLCFSKLTIMGWGFDMEVLAVAKASRLSVASVRIDDWEDKPFSTYTDGTLRVTVRMVRDFIHVTVNRIRSVYTISR
jgi:dolichyl-phosphate beta-glucosyltransferase